ncbi:MAG: carboxypeptidase-like regulatory domain-containing protein [Candidatus Methylomirabilales bacterium]
MPVMTEAAEGQPSIQGLLYISYTSDPSFDVIFGKGVEVLLLKGEEGPQKELEAVKARWLPQIRAQNAAWSKAWGEARRALGTEKQKEKTEALRREQEKLDTLRSEYEKEVRNLLARYVLQRTETDGEGKFEFAGLPPGRYLLHARFKVRLTQNSYFWLHPVELRQGEEVETHLNKAASISLYQ